MQFKNWIYQSPTILSQVQSTQFNLALSSWICYLFLYLIASATGSTEYLLRNCSIRKLKIICTISHTLRQNHQGVTPVRSCCHWQMCFWMQKAWLLLPWNAVISVLGPSCSLAALVWRFRSTHPQLPAHVGSHAQASCFHRNLNFPLSRTAPVPHTPNSGATPHLLWYWLAISSGSDVT